MRFTPDDVTCGVRLGIRIKQSTDSGVVSDRIDSVLKPTIPSFILATRRWNWMTKVGQNAIDDRLSSDFCRKNPLYVLHHKYGRGVFGDDPKVSLIKKVAFVLLV